MEIASLPDLSRGQRIDAHGRKGWQQFRGGNQHLRQRILGAQSLKSGDGTCLRNIEFTRLCAPQLVQVRAAAKRQKIELPPSD